MTASLLASTMNLLPYFGRLALATLLAVGLPMGLLTFAVVRRTRPVALWAALLLVALWTCVGFAAICALMNSGLVTGFPASFERWLENSPR